MLGYGGISWTTQKLRHFKPGYEHITSHIARAIHWFIDRAQLTADACARTTASALRDDNNRIHVPGHHLLVLAKKHRCLNSGENKFRANQARDHHTHLTGQPARQSTYSSMVYLLCLFSVSKKQKLVYGGLTGSSKIASHSTVHLLVHHPRLHHPGLHFHFSPAWLATVAITSTRSKKA